MLLVKVMSHRNTQTLRNYNAHNYKSYRKRNGDIFLGSILVFSYQKCYPRKQAVSVCWCVAVRFTLYWIDLPKGLDDLSGICPNRFLFYNYRS